VYVNKRFAEIFGYTEKELLETLKPTDVVEREERQQAEENIRKRLAGEADSVHYIAKGKRKDSAPLWIEIHGTHIELEGEQLIAGTLLDVTERKLADDEILRLNENREGLVKERTTQLETANKELEAFTYSVSHDLRAPLRAITGFSEILLAEDENFSSQTQNYLQKISNNGKQMGLLIDDLLSFSHMNRRETTMRTVDLGSIFREVAEELTTNDKSRKVDIKISGFIECTGDCAMLKQVAFRPLDHTLKYT